MPAGDGTGPMGAGPMTGRGAGYCSGYGMPGFANLGFGRGMGMGFAWGCGGGRGRGFRHRFRATGLPFWASMPSMAAGPAASEPDRQQQSAMLKAQARRMEAALEQLRQRIAELEAADPKEA